MPQTHTKTHTPKFGKTYHFLPMGYYMIDDRHYIKMTKILEIFNTPKFGKTCHFPPHGILYDWWQTLYENEKDSWNFQAWIS